MANELSRDDGIAVTLQFIKANLGTGAATTDMTFGQAGTGFIVPAGYKFHAVCLSLTFTGTLDAGATVAGKVIDNGTELTSGPVASISHRAAPRFVRGRARVLQPETEAVECISPVRHDTIKHAAQTVERADTDGNHICGCIAPGASSGQRTTQVSTHPDA